MKHLVIIGAGGFGREIQVWADQSPAGFPIRGFLDDNPRALDRFPGRGRILGRIAEHVPQPDEVFICAMGRVDFKRRSVGFVAGRGGRFETIVHRSSAIGTHARLGEGVILCPHTSVGTDAIVGDFVTLNVHATVGHDAAIGRWSILHCHAIVAGGAELGEGVTVECNATVMPGVRVGDGAVIGAGAVVMHHVPAGAEVFAIPAQRRVVGEVAGA